MKSRALAAIFNVVNEQRLNTAVFIAKVKLDQKRFH